MNERTLRVFSAITEFRQERGYPPAYRDLGRMVGIASTSTVRIHVRELVEAGLVRTDHGITRSIRVVAPQCRCPECGLYLPAQLEGRVPECPNRHPAAPARVSA